MFRTPRLLFVLALTLKLVKNFQCPCMHYTVFQKEKATKLLAIAFANLKQSLQHNRAIFYTKP